MNHEYRIGETYRDTGSHQDPDDQFLRWIRGPLDSGITNSGGIRNLNEDQTYRPAAIILVSNDKGVSQHDDPWEDIIAVDSGYIGYWGDAKPGKPYDESNQNKEVVSAFDQAASGTRKEVPPVLMFRKPRSGTVQFCGLCVPEYREVKSYVHESGAKIPNFFFHLTILNTESIPVAWLHDRGRSAGDAIAPEVWKQWAREGTISRWPTGNEIDRTSGHTREYERQKNQVSEEFRTDMFDRYQHSCLITKIEVKQLLDLAHVLSRSDHPELTEHPENVLVLNSLHHRAFDAGIFTIDSDYRIRVNPRFDSSHPFLQETILERDGEKISLPPDARLRPSFLEEWNDQLSWFQG